MEEIKEPAGMHHTVVVKDNESDLEDQIYELTK
jgi:hypothetical protein